MKNFILKSRVVFFITALVFCYSSSNAQKLPSVQKSSLRAPSNIKIDGFATEWNDKLQAHNNNVGFNYTISNDDDYLYLTIQSTDKIIINRILKGGISLFINKENKKSEKNTQSVTYPCFDKNDHFIAAFLPRQISKNDEEVNLIMDSLAKKNNLFITQKAKYIKTSGISSVDSVISVYNTNDIKAVALFNNKLAYTVELAIGLKELALLRQTKFTYEIKINESAPKGIVTQTNDMGDVLSVRIGDGAITGQPATYFWAEYVLAN